MTETLCSTCRFFRPGKPERGWCHRFPRAPTGDMYTDRYGDRRPEFSHPPVHVEDWCGEHQPKSAPETPALRRPTDSGTVKRGC